MALRSSVLRMIGRFETSATASTVKRIIAHVTCERAPGVTWRRSASRSGSSRRSRRRSPSSTPARPDSEPSANSSSACEKPSSPPPSPAASSLKTPPTLPPPNSSPTSASSHRRPEPAGSCQPAWSWAQVQDVGQVDLGRQRIAEVPQWRQHEAVPSGRERLRGPHRHVRRHGDALRARGIRTLPPRGWVTSLLNEGQTPELLGRPAMYRGDPSGGRLHEQPASIQGRSRHRTGVGTAGVPPSHAQRQVHTRVAHHHEHRPSLGYAIQAGGVPVPPAEEQRASSPSSNAILVHRGVRAGRRRVDWLARRRCAGRC